MNVTFFKKTFFLAFFVFVVVLLVPKTTLAYTAGAFVTTWNTSNPGSDNNTTITIPTYSGDTYNYNVDWGDGNTDTGDTGNATHSYTTAGTYTVSITGTFPRIYFDGGGDGQKIMSVDQWGTNTWDSMASAFVGCSNLNFDATDTPDLSNVTDMSGMFDNATSFNSNIDNWNVSNVTDMSAMFYLASSFNQPLDNWNVSNVTDMGSMFNDDGQFNQDLSSWNTSNVTDMRYMFWGTPFNQPLDSWNVSNVTDMSDMFEGDRSFNQPLDSWNVGDVTDMAYMFNAANSFDQPLNSWNVSNVIDMYGMFSGDFSFNQPLDSWNVSNVTDMGCMFFDNSFNQPLSSWNVSNVTDMSGMFEDNTAFNQSLSSWNVGNVTSMDSMFSYSSFDQDISNWDISNVRNMQYMFTNDALSTPNYDNLLIDWAGESVHHGITFDAGNSHYCLASAKSARGTLTGTDGWTITDGGGCPYVSTATVSGTTMILTYNENLVESSVPATSDFSVNDNGSLSRISNITIVGSVVTLTLGAPVGAGDPVTVSYTSGSNPIEDSDGNLAVNLDNYNVSNPPVFSTATVNGSTLIITYDEPLSTSTAPAPTDFVVNDNGNPITVSSLYITGSTVILTLTAPMGGGDPATISYTPGIYPIKNTNGDLAASLVDQSVANLPVLSTAEIVDTTLTITYNEPLDTSSVPVPSDFVVYDNGTPVTISNVQITGSTVVLTLVNSTGSDDVYVSYTPGSNPIEDSNSNEASALSWQSVTNGNSFTFNYIAGPNGSLTGDTTQTVVYQDSGTPVTAVPDAGYAFLGWSDGDIDNPRTDNAYSDFTATAQFVSDCGLITVGSSPTFATAVGNNLYVVNQDGTVSVVDTETNKTTDTITVGNLPLDIVSLGTNLYVTNSNDNTVSVIDTTNNTVTATIPVGENPVYENLVGTNLYVMNDSRRGGTVSVIDTRTNTVTGTVNVGSYPGQGVLLNDSYLYVPNNGDNTVSAINTVNNTVSTITVGQNPGAAVLVGRTEIYVVNQSDGTVSVIDTGDNTVTATIPVGNYPSAATLVGTNLYVTNQGDNTVSVIDTTTNAVTATIPVGQNPEFAILVGNNLYVLNQRDNTVSVIDTTNNEVTSTITVGQSPSSANLIGNNLYVLNNRGNNVSIINTLTNNTLTCSASIPPTPSISTQSSGITSGGMAYVCTDPKASNYDTYQLPGNTMCKYSISSPIVIPTAAQVLGSGTCPTSLIITQNLKNGDHDGKRKITQVTILQKQINRILAESYNQAAGPTDGIFGNLTRQGVERLQTVLNSILKPNPPLVIDGIIGPFTRKAINDSCGK